MTSLDTSKPFAPSEAQKKGIQKHQAVFTLDFDTWQEINEVYGMKDCVIPHREEASQVYSRRGWYG